MTKKALIVGINAYAPPNALPSCVADAEGMNSLLQGRYAFDSVTMLRDGEATKEKLTASLAELFSNVTHDDRLVFYFQVMDIRTTRTARPSRRSLLKMHSSSIASIS